MQRFSLEAVRPLIHSSAVDGRRLHVVFRCPVTSERVESAWQAPPLGVSAQIADERGTVLFQVRRQLNGVVRDVLGYGHLGRLARTASDTALGSVTTLTTTEEERGLVEAFRRVSDAFRWDGARWIHDSEGRETTGWTRTVRGEALDAYERDVAARMLVAVARAHGGISEAERLHLADVFDGAGSLAGLLERPPLTRAELQQTRADVRPVLLAVAWSMALCDEAFDPEEGAVLEQLADQLGLDLEARVDVKRQAQQHVIEAFLERALDWGGHDRAARSELHALATRIGVPRAAVERAEATVLRRRAT